MIRHWCDAVDDRNPVYTDAAYAAKSCHGGIVAPPAMLQAWSMRGLAPAEVRASRASASPIGVLRLAATDRGVVRIEFPRGSGSGFRGWLRRTLPDAQSVETLPALQQVQGELEAYFAGALERFETPLDLRGTGFQRDVWEALRRIPYGETRTYAEVAAEPPESVIERLHRASLEFSAGRKREDDMTLVALRAR